MGGIAGGIKYIVRGMLFKLCIDIKPDNNDYYIYSGGMEPDHESAAKTAGHELKGAMHYFTYGLLNKNGNSYGSTNDISNHINNNNNNNDESYKIDVLIPMRAIVDYCGYRALVIPCSPIKKTASLIYGSDNAGTTICVSDTKFNTWMKNAANYLHLATHHVFDKPPKHSHKSPTKYTIHSAIDVEGIVLPKVHLLFLMLKIHIIIY